MSASWMFRAILTRPGCCSAILSNTSKLIINERLVVNKSRLTSYFGLDIRHLHSKAGQQHTINPNQDTFESLQTREKLIDRVKGYQKNVKIVSLANIITTSRALMAPAIAYFIVNNMHSPALVCCTYAVFSDILDKTAAYYTKQSSPLNGTLDALADKLLIITCCVALYKMDIMSIYMLKSVVIRDFIIVAGGIAIRYHGFDEKPTLKKFLDVNNYPSLCFNKSLLNQIVTGLQYSVILSHLAFNHLSGDPLYDWSIFFWQGFAMLMSSASAGWYLTTFGQNKFITPPPKVPH